MPSTVDKDSTTSMARVAVGGVVLMEVHTTNVGELSVILTMVGIANSATEKSNGRLV